MAVSLCDLPDELIDHILENLYLDLPSPFVLRPPIDSPVRYSTYSSGAESSSDPESESESEPDNKRDIQVYQSLLNVRAVCRLLLRVGTPWSFRRISRTFFLQEPQSDEHSRDESPLADPDRNRNTFWKEMAIHVEVVVLRFLNTFPVEMGEDEALKQSPVFEAFKPSLHAMANLKVLVIRAANTGPCDIFVSSFFSEANTEFLHTLYVETEEPLIWPSSAPNMKRVNLQLRNSEAVHSTAAFNQILAPCELVSLRTVMPEMEMPWSTMKELSLDIISRDEDTVFNLCRSLKMHSNEASSLVEFYIKARWDSWMPAPYSLRPLLEAIPARRLRRLTIEGELVKLLATSQTQAIRLAGDLFPGLEDFGIYCTQYTWDSYEDGFGTGGWNLPNLHTFRCDHHFLRLWLNWPTDEETEDVGSYLHVFPARVISALPKLRTFSSRPNQYSYSWPREIYACIKPEHEMEIRLFEDDSGFGWGMSLSTKLWSPESATTLTASWSDPISY